MVSILDQLVRARAASARDDVIWQPREFHDPAPIPCIRSAHPWPHRRTSRRERAAMSPLATIALLLFTGAITPGPNNLLVLRAVADRGWRGGLGGVAAIVGGSVVLLALAIGGFGALVDTWPGLRSALGAAGALYLAWLGAGLLRGTADTPRHGPRRDGALALFLFQFVNPKGWLLMLVVAAAAPAGETTATVLRLLPMTVAITGACLLLWALLGRALAEAFAHPVRRRWIDRASGIALLACALPLLA
jgi:threonine/homoserine/homoserine lactone efflux protein